MRTNVIKYLVSLVSFVILLYLLNVIKLYSLIMDSLSAYLAMEINDLLVLRISPSELKAAFYLLILLVYLKFEESSMPTCLSLSIVLATLLFKTRYVEILPSFNIRFITPFNDYEIFTAFISGFILISLFIFAEYFDRIEKIALKQLEMDYDNSEVEEVKSKSIKYVFAIVAATCVLSCIILFVAGIVPISMLTYPLMQALGLLALLLVLLYLQSKI